MNHTLPAGLFSSQKIEFFANHGLHAFCLSDGSVVPFKNFGESVLQMIETDIAAHPRKAKALTSMGKNGRMERIEQYLVCNYGGFDNTPDMVDGHLMKTEYWACPKRGKCKFEGVLCDSLRTQSGEVLSRREIEVLKLIATGSLDKEIADELHISIATVPTHTRNIRRKTMLARKADLTRFATLKNLI